MKFRIIKSAERPQGQQFVKSYSFPCGQAVSYRCLYVQRGPNERTWKESRQPNALFLFALSSNPAQGPASPQACLHPCCHPLLLSAGRHTAWPSAYSTLPGCDQGLLPSCYTNLRSEGRCHFVGTRQGHSPVSRGIDQRSGKVTGVIIGLSRRPTSPMI